jgi:hypothetical protein
MNREFPMDAVGSIRHRHESALLALPNVIGVGTGRDETGSEVIDVYVQRKVPRQELSPGETIPDALEGVPVRVVPIGEVTAQAP